MARTVCGIAKAEYLPASFNGVPFTAVEVSSEHGRRGAEGEFPFGESTAYADLGRRIRTYSLSGKIQDDNFLGNTAFLIAACELPGPGVLVHPTRGIISAACKSLKVSDKIEEEAGVTYVDMEFVEGNAWPNGLSLVGSILGILLSGIVNASRANFVEQYNPQKVSTHRRPQVIATAQATVSQIRDEYQAAVVGTTDSSKYSILSDLNEAADNPDLLVYPEIADRAIALGLNAISLEREAQVKFDAMRRTANFNAKSSTLQTLIGGREENAIYSHARTIAAAYMAQGAMETRYTRRFQVFNAVDTISTVLSDEAVIARQNCFNDLYLEITKFETDVQTQLYSIAYTVPGLVSFDFNGGVYSLTAAYSIFGDAKRHRELEEGNIIDGTGRIGPDVIANV